MIELTKSLILQFLETVRQGQGDIERWDFKKIVLLNVIPKRLGKCIKYDSSIRTVVEDSLIIVIRNGEIVWKHLLYC